MGRKLLVSSRLNMVKEFLHLHRSQISLTSRREPGENRIKYFRLLDDTNPTVLAQHLIPKVNKRGRKK